MADIKVNLAFTADTKQAQASIQQLQQSLSQISTAGMKSSVSKEMAQASAAAKELSYHLNQAFNAKTGNFDLSRLDRSLKASGTNVQALSTKLLSAGQTGQQAFVQLAQSIALADRPMINLSSRLSGLFTTLKNTAKWQISSTILHGFMGAVQQAYGYAQDLNQSLNNIRIVTGYNADQMAQFANEANKAAKALSTTTTAYTDASLIYYQQGLRGEDVRERTDATIKLANVSRQSAEEVSSQMTAIWNNFDDGTKSLEYYADAITALGAKTASSSAEIAEGLQKFAAVSDTVGLSYEYATAALATVVAQTRQSADTVGTAFKTLFARIEGLKLGETLEDGTTFNQYSEALAKIGVNIKDSNGELRNMDNILDDLGVKWKELNRDEQVAVAQKVAGVRQYQQMIALMDNYDIFKENVLVAADSEGTLSKQADIYAESWEAASKRVKASAQAIYTDLLDDSFFIKMTNGLSNLLDSVDAFIDGMGGIQPLIIGIGSLFFNIFSSKIPSALNNLKANFQVVFQGAAKAASQLTLAMTSSSLDTLYSKSGTTMNDSMRQALQNTINLTTAKNKLSAVQKNLTAEELQGAQATLTYIQQQQHELQVLADKITQHKANIDILKTEIDVESAGNQLGKSRMAKQKKLESEYQSAEDAYAEDTRGANLGKVNEAWKKLKEFKQGTLEAAETLDVYTDKLAEAYFKEMELSQGAELSAEHIYELGECFTPFIDKLNKIETSGDFNTMKKSIIEVRSQLEMAAGDSVPGLQDALEKAVVAGNTKTLVAAIEKVKKILAEAKISADQLPEALRKMGQGEVVDKVDSKYKVLKKDVDELTNKQKELNNTIKGFKPQHVVTGIEKITQTAASFGQLYMAVSAVKSLFDAWNNEDLSFGEKIMTSLMSISMFVPGVIGTFTSLSKVLNLSTIAEMAMAEAAYNTAAATGFEITVNETKQALQKMGIAADQIEILMSKEKAGATLEELAADQAINTSTLAKIAIEKLGLTADQASIVAKELKAGASLKEALATAGVTVAEGSSIPVKLAHAAATFLQTAATQGLIAALIPLLPAIIGITMAIAALTVIIGAIVIGIKSLTEESNRYSEATKKSQERVDEFTEQLKDAKTEAENLKTTISNWDSAITALSELDKHTEEYANKLKEANRQAQDLIETYGLYDQYTIENGQIKFNEGVLEKLQHDADNKVKVIDDYLSAAKIANDKMQSDKLAYDLSKKMSYTAEGRTRKQSGTSYKTYKTENVSENAIKTTLNSLSRFIENYNKDPETGKDLGTKIIPPLDAIKEYLKTNESIPEEIRNNLNNWGDDLIRELVEASNEHNTLKTDAEFQADQARKNLISHKYGAQLDAMAKDSSGQTDYGKKEDLINIFNSIQKNLDSKGLNYSSAGILHGGSGGSFDSAESNNKAPKLLEDLLLDATKKAKEKVWRNEDLDVKDDEDLARTYAKEVKNVSDDELDKLHYTQKSGKVTLSNGNENLFADKTTAEMRTELQEKRFTDQAYSNYENSLSDGVLQSLERISVAGSQYGAKLGADLNQALVESFANEGQSIDLSSIFGDLDQSEVNKLMKQAADPERLMESLGLNTEDLNNLGYENAAQFAQAFSDGLSSWDAETAASQFKDKLAAATAADAEEFGLDPDMLQEVAEGFLAAADAGDEMYAALKGNAEKASDIARDYIRMNNAVLDLSDNYDDYAKVLKEVQGTQKDADKAMAANSKTGKALKKSLSDLIGTSEKMINTKFLDAIDPKDFDAAAKGDVAAIGRIRDAFIDCNAPIEATSDEIQDFKDKIANADEGATLDLNNDPFLQKLIAAELAAGSSAEDIRDKLSGMGIQCDLTEFTGTMEEAKEFARQTGGQVADSLSMESEINPGVDVEQGEITEQAFTENYEAGTPIPVESETPEMQPDGSMQLVPLHGYFTPGIKTVNTEAVTADTQGVVAAPSVNVTTGDGQEGKVGKHTIINNPTKKTNTVSSNTRDTANNNRSGCFIAGTLVSLGFNFKNIEDIKIGDIVLSYNEQTKKNEYSEVLQTMIHIVNEKIYDLYIENEILSVTGVHKFLIKRNNYYDWIPASELQINDQVFFADETWHFINEIKINLQFTTVYNFEVANNHNYYVGKNQILAHNKGGGGKGGGGKSTPAEKKSLTKKSDVVNRYKQIEDKLKVVNKNLDKYNALADLAYGKEKIKNMNNIIKAYDRQIKLQQQLIDEARNYAAIDQQGLNAAASELNVKLKYDKDGNIANIESVQQKIWEKLNALETEYNNQPTKEAQDEYQKKYIDPFNEKKDEFDKMLGLYESSLDKMNEATQTKLELEIEKMSKKLELANYKIKLKIEIRTDELEQFEEELEKLNDTAFTGAKKLAYFRAEMQAIKDISSTSKKGIKNALKNGIYKEGDSVKTGWRPITDSKGNTVYNKDGTIATEKYRYKETISLGDYMKSLGLSSADKKEIYNQILNQEAPKKLGYKTYEDFEKDWNFSEALIEELKEFKDVLKDANDALDEVKESVDSMIIDTFEHWQEVMEKNIRQAEHYANLSETWLDIIEQISGRAGMSSAQLKNLRQTDFDTQKNLVAATWQDYKMTSQQYEASKPAFKAMYDAEEANAKAAEDMVKKLDEQIGNYAGKDYNNKKSNDSAFAKATGDRAVKAKLEDKLANPEKYYGDKNYFKTKEGKAEKERLEEKLDKYTKRINAAKEERRQYELLAKESHDKAQQSLSDQQQMLDKVNELKEQGIQGFAQLIEKADEMLDKELHDLLNDFERSISGIYGSIDNMKTAFDQNKEIDERYIRDTEKIYELNKLNRDLEKKMDETSNVKAKQKLAELQEKIYKYAAEGVKMSKYDLEVMQKQYDLEVAKIALEEAQNAKTQVRLTRDAEGNYSYTYTADENKTAEAEQNYEDKLNDLIQYNNDYAVETQSAILSAQQSWEDAIEDLLSRRKEFTEEEYYAKLQEINAYYTSQLQYFAGENEKASQHSMSAFVLEYDSYYDNTQKKIGVTRMFTDEEKANYEKVAEIYENAAIERDKEMFLEEQHYKDQIELINQNYQSELARANQYFDDKFTALENSYKAGYLTEEEYLNLRAELENKKNEEIKRIEAQKNTDLENAARGHIDMINGITDDYHKDLKEDIELENGEHQAASDYWQGLMEKDYLVNGEYMGKIKDGNMGFITDTQSQFLPGLNTTYTSATETVKGFTEAITDGKGDNGNNTLMGQINNAVDQNNKNVAAAMGAIELATSETGETAFEDLASTATSEINDINEASEGLAEQINADVASGIADMELSSASVVDWYNDCYPSWHSAKADIDAITSALNNMIATAADVKPINVSVKTDLNTPSSTETKEKKTKTSTTKTKTKTTTTSTTTTDDKTTTGGTKTTATSTQGDGKLQVGDKVTLLSQGYEDSWGNGKKISKDYIGKTVKINKYSNADKVIGGTSKTTGDYYISLSTLAGGDLGWVKKKQISGYDTGGYTGTWGRDGRFALLHQKELVLNEEDTQNMLAAVKTVREIAAMIDLQAQQANLAGQYALALGQLPFAHSKGMDQNVHITAEFPNVQDHNEVELALTSLVNRASQFAWRN